MFAAILLDCIQSIQGERSISGIHNLIQGKKSSQTLQDARLYKLERYFGIYPSLSKLNAHKTAESLERRNFIRFNQENHPVLTDEGEKYLEDSFMKDGNFFSGMEHHRNIILFEKRLRLLIQTVTHSELKDFAFLPIVEDPSVQAWMKRLYRNNVISDLLTSLYEELNSVLSALSHLEAELFTRRLTGGGLIGETREQLAHDYHLSVEDVDLLIKHALFYMYRITLSRQENYPALTLCLEGMAKETLITSSAKQTLQWLNIGLSLEDIVQKRRLKLSTIQDHVVEAALIDPSFDIDGFISKEGQKDILTTLENLNTNKLKKLFEALDHNYNYFEIRLVVASSKHTFKEDRHAPSSTS
ncbi:helix-turn-helix domain-containing protein [Halobacillus sp. A1]|uniref:helix-turn-helix domain-containing protein n=1 Tax=Halobacillus sp. A1 TaxID=2880262 RepID=UPI0020A63253|nr:helix-turn-helix domain-containing protein [Halobacillus sp. A1]MCP3032689.1 helix-turn-helix domain-containing protein [Halobacillus sp. A1]